MWSPHLVLSTGGIALTVGQTSWQSLVWAGTVDLSMSGYSMILRSALPGNSMANSTRLHDSTARASRPCSHNVAQATAHCVKAAYFHL
jgi:hypothetical protein